MPRYREDAFQDLFKPADQPDKPSVRPGVPVAPGRPPAKPDALPDAPARAADAGARPADDKRSDEAAPAGRKPPAKPVRIVFEGIRERATTLPLGMSADTPVISPDGKTLVFRSRQGDRDTLYSYDLDELARGPATPHELVAGAKATGDYGFTPNSKTVFYRERPLREPKPAATPSWRRR